MSDDNWNSRAANWDDDPDVVLYADKAFEACEQFVFPHIPNLASASVLDFGCGTGLLAAKLSGQVADINAVDTSQGMTDILRNNAAVLDLKNITVTCADILDPSAPIHQQSLNRFDLIVASSVCSFLDDYPLALTRLSSFLKPGGIWVQWDWAADMPESKIRNAFEASRLKVEHLEIAFEMNFGEDVYPVIMAVGRQELAASIS